MDLSPNRLCSAFLGHRRLASGALHFVAQEVKNQLGDAATTCVIIDNHTSDIIEVDFRGDRDTFAAQFIQQTPANESNESHEAQPDSTTKRGRGRPKLGVVAKEITLLPKHWDWLSQQPGGASVTLRKLVVQAQRQTGDATRIRQAQAAVYKFMTVIAPGLAEYEEALRALYAGNATAFAKLIEPWPKDVKTHLRKLALPAFAAAQYSH